MPYLLLFLFVVAILVLVVLVPRWNELFLISFRDGEVLLVRGRCPPTLLGDICDVLHRDGVQRASIRALRAADGAQLVLAGVDDSTAQRLRNTFRLHPLAQLRSAPGPDSPNAGQVLGIVWLAWVFAGLARRR